MTSDVMDAIGRAEKLAGQAHKLGLIRRPENEVAEDGIHLARVELLSKMLLKTRMGHWTDVSTLRADWEFSDAFGPIVRMAQFELSDFPGDAGWNELLALFRLYLGKGVDKIMLSVFLAAATSPDLILSQKLILDCQLIVDRLSPGQTAFESFS